MRTRWQRVGRFLLGFYLLVIHLALAYFVGEKFLIRYTAITPVNQDSVGAVANTTPIPTPLPVPEHFADPTPAVIDGSVADGRELIIPVLGVKPEQLIDTFSQSRSGDRFHDAIDIAAPVGTPVVAAADGEIVKFFDSERGGITIYQLTDDRRFMLYYGHLQRRADGITEGMRVRRGTTIGYVGDTGNAGAGNYHLHFSIAVVSDPKRLNDGTYLNPYPLLRAGRLSEHPITP